MCVRPLCFRFPFVASKITPPLRGSQQDKGEARSRAGGGRFYFRIMPPTDSAFAQNDRPHRLPLKGGVILVIILLAMCRNEAALKKELHEKK